MKAILCGGNVYLGRDWEARGRTFGRILSMRGSDRRRSKAARFTKDKKENIKKKEDKGAREFRVT